MYLESKFLNLLSSQLRNFKRKSNNVWNFSCPFCGDSQKSTRKARGYVYSKGDKLLYTCHNCGLSTNVPKLIKHVSPTLYEEYVKESLAEKYQPKKDRAEELAVQVKKTAPTELWKEWLKLIPVYQLPDNHPCKMYVEKRQIPKEWHRRLWWCPAFFEWTNLLIPHKFSKEACAHDEGRLIIPLRTKDKNIFGYQGRSIKEKLDNNEQRYYTIILDETKPKIFGLEFVDLERTFYVFEGPIDAMFIPNSIATAGGGFIDLGTDAVYCYDNEPRSKETCKKLHKVVMMGYKVCIWPTSVTEKDVNEMVMNGVSADFIKRMIEHSTFSGLNAQLAFHGWKKI